jgi:ferredoxin
MRYEQIKSIVALLAILASFSIFGWQIYQFLWLNLRRGRPSFAFKDWGKRIEGLFVYVVGQFRLFRFFPPGITHFFIFWGFLLLSMTILQAMIEGLVAFADPNFVIPLLGTFGPLALLQDLFAVFVTVAILYALYMRLVVNPKRYEGSHKAQGVMVLLFILTIMLSLLVMNGARINLGEDPIAEWRPISAAVGSLFAGLEENGQFLVKEISYWIHLGVVLVFLTELPMGKHFHVITSVPAVLLRNLEPRGRLAALQQTNGDAGVRVAEHLRWRQILDLYTCTECGRCQEVCPAFNSGLALSPKVLMMCLRDNLKERGAQFFTTESTHFQALATAHGKARLLDKSWSARFSAKRKSGAAPPATPATRSARSSSSMSPRGRHPPQPGDGRAGQRRAAKGRSTTWAATATPSASRRA